MWRALPLVALLGCPNNGREDLDGPHCEDTPTAVALDEVTDLGFTAQALLDLATGAHDETFRWARDGSTTPLALAVTYGAGEARFVDSEPVYPEGGEQPAIGVICDDRVEVDVTVSFATDDGAFTEVLDLALTAVAGDRVEMVESLDPDGLVGTYDMSVDITEPTYDARSLWLRGAFTAEGASGEVSGQVSGEDECSGDTCSAWASEVAVGTWGPVPE